MSVLAAVTAPASSPSRRSPKRTAKAPSASSAAQNVNESNITQTLYGEKLLTIIVTRDFSGTRLDKPARGHDLHYRRRAIELLRNCITNFERQRFWVLTRTIFAFRQDH